MGLSWSRHKLHPVISTLSSHEWRKETQYFIKLHLGVLKYCAHALQAAVESKLVEATLGDPEFVKARKDINPDVIYDKLKSICKRNHSKQKKWRFPSPSEDSRIILWSFFYILVLI